MTNPKTVLKISYIVKIIIKYYWIKNSRKCSSNAKESKKEIKQQKSHEAYRILKKVKWHKSNYINDNIKCKWIKYSNQMQRFSDSIKCVIQRYTVHILQDTL